MSAVASIEIENPEVWHRLESSPQWAALTKSQRLWVLDFIVSGSALSATKAAYNAKSEANARLLSYELAKNPKIVAALDVAAGRTPKVVTVDVERARLIREVRKQLAAAEPGSIAAQKLMAQLERLVIGIKAGRREVEDDEPATATPRFNVGDICVQDGKKYRVTAVNAEGAARKQSCSWRHDKL